ncbi:FEM1B [Symbiodinium natans]|uniref:FEM1B protein n=1 Tax=Symbiodinium natans TaxID=878477 RepID=A0A812KB34_9DINO|nr:FEM1B [Symbiodinium natans]
MTAGRSGVRWTGPAVCGTIARGNLSMMRLLVDFEANLNGRVIKFNGEPNVTLLYDASYFGHAHLVRYLLQQKGNPDTAVKFQDDMTITKTALHIAASLGHEEVVRVLLAAKAQVAHALPSGGGPPELRDAVDGCHVEVVKLLVQGKADVFGGDLGKRGIDHIFEANNSVLVAATATGLKQSTSAGTSSMLVEDFIHFLSTPDAEEIVNAVFCNCELRYWQLRLTWQTPIGQQDHMDEEFFSHLLPRRFDKIPGQSQIPVHIYQCLLPGLHRNPEVLWVIASGVNDRIFDQKGARAIIQLAWREAEIWQIIAFVLDVIMAVLFALMALLQHDPHWIPAVWLRAPCLVVAALIWLRKVIHEILSCRGHFAHGKLKQHFLSMGFAGDVVRISITAVSLVGLAVSWESFQKHQELVFACTGFLRWLRVLNNLKGFESTGKPMLPILQAVPATKATGPFFFVVFCWFAAFVHLYYSFGLGDFWSGATILYNLGFLAETSNSILPEDGESADWRLLVDLVVMVMSFSMSIILLNVLIGVLAESYNRGWEHRERLFLLERSRFLVNHFTMSYAWKKCPCQKRRVRGEEDVDYVWYAYPRTPSTWGDINSDFDSMDMNVHEKMSELRREVREAMQKFAEKAQAQDPTRVADVERKVDDVRAKLDHLTSMLQDRSSEMWS